MVSPREIRPVARPDARNQEIRPARGIAHRVAAPRPSRSVRRPFLSLEQAISAELRAFGRTSPRRVIPRDLPSFEVARSLLRTILTLHRGCTFPRYSFVVVCVFCCRSSLASLSVACKSADRARNSSDKMLSLPSTGSPRPSIQDLITSGGRQRSFSGSSPHVAGLGVRSKCMSRDDSGTRLSIVVCACP